MRQLSPARTPIRTATWLLPWVAALLLASGLAYAADNALLQRWSVAPPDRSAPPADPESPRWINVTLTSTEGGRYGMRCLVRPGFFSTDSITVDVQDFGRLAAEACLQLEARNDNS
jgi:hypothetical protein